MKTMTILIAVALLAPACATTNDGSADSRNRQAAKWSKQLEGNEGAYADRKASMDTEHKVAEKAGKAALFTGAVIGYSAARVSWEILRELPR